MLRAVVLSSNRFGHYELLRPLGAGGMAETFVAVRRGPGGFEQRVCLRRILPAYADEQRFVELFLDEARLLAHLHNANIVQVLDFGAVESQYYMALELVEGVDLDVLMRAASREQRRLPVPVCAYIASQLLSALDYAHSATVNGQPINLVHRDISPGNVLLSLHGEVKLTDFGIARASTRRHKTRTGFTKGKLAYMSPEQIQGYELDARSDLFALGVLLFELLTGRHPFEGDTDLALINNILSGTRPDLENLAPGLPMALIRLVEVLLEISPDHRPKSAGEALRLLPFVEPTYVSQRALSELVTARYAQTSQGRAAAMSEERPVSLSMIQETQPLRLASARGSESTSSLTPERSHALGLTATHQRRRKAGRWLASLAAAGGLATAALFMTERAAPSKPEPPAREASQPQLETAPEPPRTSKPDATRPAREEHNLPNTAQRELAGDGGTAMVTPVSTGPDKHDGSSRSRRRARGSKPTSEVTPSNDAGVITEERRARGHSGASVSEDDF